MSRNLIGNEEDILEASEEDVSDEDNIQFEDLEEDYDSDNDPEYFPPNEEEEYDNILAFDIEEIEIGQANKKLDIKRKERSSDEPSTSQAQVKKVKKVPLHYQLHQLKEV